jgi:hypothetical protein
MATSTYTLMGSEFPPPPRTLPGYRQNHRKQEEPVNQPKERTSPPPRSSEVEEHEKIQEGKQPAAKTIKGKAENDRPVSIARNTGAEEKWQAEAGQAHPLRAVHDRRHRNGGDKSPYEDPFDLSKCRGHTGHTVALAGIFTFARGFGIG